LQIVVTNGRMVPDDTRKGSEDLHPPFMTWRQQVDGHYWFPVYTKGEGVLHFSGGSGYNGPGRAYAGHGEEYSRLQAVWVNQQDHLQRAGKLATPAKAARPRRRKVTAIKSAETGNSARHPSFGNSCIARISGLKPRRLRGVGRELRISLGHQHTVVDAHAVGGITLFDPNEDFARSCGNCSLCPPFLSMTTRVLSPM